MLKSHKMHTADETGYCLLPTCSYGCEIVQSKYWQLQQNNDYMHVKTNFYKHGYNAQTFDRRSDQPGQVQDCEVECLISGIIDTGDICHPCDKKGRFMSIADA